MSGFDDPVLTYAEHSFEISLELHTGSCYQVQCVFRA
jgi:hypothetical protein